MPIGFCPPGRLLNSWGQSPGQPRLIGLASLTGLTGLTGGCIACNASNALWGALPPIPSPPEAFRRTGSAMGGCIACRASNARQGPMQSNCPQLAERVRRFDEGVVGAPAPIPTNPIPSSPKGHRGGLTGQFSGNAWSVVGKQSIFCILSCLVQKELNLENSSVVE